MRTLIASMTLSAFALALAGCNTVAGAGKDIERGGEKIQDASAKVRADWRAARDRNERDYDAARARCAAQPTQPERDACRDRARTEYVAHMNDARTTYKRNEMHSASDEDRREEAYETARARCDALRGADEDRCVADARSRYGRS